MYLRLTEPLLSVRKKEIRLINDHLALPNAQRLRLFDTYRGRGHRNSNLFLVYSVKTDQDWILPSDRRLVHWIYHLETDPDVRDFTFVSESDNRNSACIVDVLLNNGTRIKHQLDQKRMEHDSQAPDTQNALSVGNASMETRVFTDENLRPVVRISLRWLKPIAFASALRDQEYTRQTLMLLEYFRRRGSGDIRQVLDTAEVCEHESAVILGLMVRLCIKGHIKLDLTANGFGYCTPWMLSLKEP